MRDVRLERVAEGSGGEKKGLESWMREVRVGREEVMERVDLISSTGKGGRQKIDWTGWVPEGR